MLRDARHAMHDILLLRISAILPEAISDGGLTPTTDTDLLLATYRGGSHFTSDITEKTALRLPSLTYFLIKTLLCSFDDLILKCLVKISEMITVTCNTNDQITVFIRVILCIDQSLPVYDIELDMMSVQIKV